MLFRVSVTVLGGLIGLFSNGAASAAPFTVNCSYQETKNDGTPVSGSRTITIDLDDMKYRVKGVDKTERINNVTDNAITLYKSIFKLGGVVLVTIESIYRESGQYDFINGDYNMNIVRRVGTCSETNLIPFPLKKF